MATLNSIKKSLGKIERNARKQIAALQKAAQQGLPKLPIGPGPITQVQKAVRKVRRELNARLMQLDRSLTRLAAQARNARRAR